jgi:hypothetical protein
VHPNIGYLRLGKLNALHVQRLYAAKLDEGLSPGTRGREGHRPVFRSGAGTFITTNPERREVFVVSESPYIRWLKNKDPKPGPNYVYELDVLRAMVRQEDRQGNAGWGGTWTKERYQKLKDKHPEALIAFEAELRWERGEAQLRRDILEKYKRSSYIAEVEGWPDSGGKDKYLRDLKRLKDVMIRTEKLGYRGYAMGMIYGKLKNRYPKAHEAFEEELGG